MWSVPPVTKYLPPEGERERERETEKEESVLIPILCMYACTHSLTHTWAKGRTESEVAHSVLLHELDWRGTRKKQTHNHTMSWLG